MASGASLLIVFPLLHARRASDHRTIGNRRRRPRWLTCFLGVALARCSLGFAQDSTAPAIATQARPVALQTRAAKLQVINGGSRPLNVFIVTVDEERLLGDVQPGQDRNFSVEVGNQCLLVPASSSRSDAKTNRNDATPPEVAHPKRQVSVVVPLQAIRYDPSDSTGIPAFYTQRTDAGGLPIVASSRVSRFALAEAAYLINLMLANRDDVRQAMIQSGSRLCILAHDEFTTDQPEFARLANRPVRGYAEISARDYWDARARGMGGSEQDPFCSCGEENLLAYRGDPYARECILIHELAHNIHLRGLANVDPTFDQRLRAAYDQAMERGLWKGMYASVNHHEYFAEGVQSWFDDNRENDSSHNHVNTRAELIEYDSQLADLCREVFGDTELRYTKPQTRLHGHLKGHDPSLAPSFRWPQRLEVAQEAIQEAAKRRAAAGAN